MQQERSRQSRLLVFFEVNNSEIEHTQACAATCFWFASSLDGAVDGLYERSVDKKSEGPQVQSFCDMKDLENYCPKLASFENGFVRAQKTSKKMLMRHAKNVFFAKLGNEGRNGRSEGRSTARTKQYHGEMKGQTTDRRRDVQHNQDLGSVAEHGRKKGCTT